MKRTLLILVIFIMTSCGSMDKKDSIVRRHDFFNQFSKTELKATSNWKIGDDILILRKNHTFRYYSKVMGIINSGYYSGTYKVFNDSISFVFLKNHKPAFFENDTLTFGISNDFKVLKTKKGNYMMVLKDNR
ncbi:hypothetical protein [Flavobacterium sp.]|uniref:hypothetical protein n=1 Tax=Flavobacterium sp. TaxID=239 RepID=UPI00391B190A